MKVYYIRSFAHRSRKTPDFDLIFAGILLSPISMFVKR